MTIITVQVVSLSQAQQKHEAYVAAPDGTTARQKQINAFVDAMQTKAVSKSQIVTPNSSCGSGAQEVHIYWNPTSISPSREMYSEVDYDHNSDCTVYIDYDTQYDCCGGSGPDIYWSDSKYGSGDWNRNCTNVSGDIPITFNVGGPPHNQNLQFIQTDSSGSNCTIFDTYESVDVGTLN